MQVKLSQIYGKSYDLIGGLQDSSIEIVWLGVHTGSDKDWHGILTQLCCDM
jgi:hypothetical protein